MKFSGAFMLLVLAGCGVEPAPGGGNVVTTNPALSVDVLFDIDGCRVYRFYDHGEHRYFASCAGGVSSADRRSNGKSTYTKEFDVPTAVRP